MLSVLRKIQNEKLKTALFRLDLIQLLTELFKSLIKMINLLDMLSLLVILANLSRVLLLHLENPLSQIGHFVPLLLQQLIHCHHRLVLKRLSIRPSLLGLLLKVDSLDPLSLSFGINLIIDL